MQKSCSHEHILNWIELLKLNLITSFDSLHTSLKKSYYFVTHEEFKSSLNDMFQNSSTASEHSNNEIEDITRVIDSTPSAISHISSQFP